MSATSGSTPPEERPDGEPAEPAEPAAQPPYPGWSTQQPGTSGWGDPSGAGSSGAGSSGAGSSGSGPASGWSAGPAVPAWQIPDAKPGVIPLRPLGVGEILDGAVTTIRRNLGAMLGLSAVVAAVTQLLSTGGLVWLFGDQVTEPDLGLSDGDNNVEAIEHLSAAIPGVIIGAFVTMIATVFLTGVLTVVVGQAVLGRRLSAREAWHQAKGRLLRLLGLTFLYLLVWLSPLFALFAVVVLVAVADISGALIILAVLAALVCCVWLYVRYALSLPALMLETSEARGGAPIRVVESLRRSARLVRGSWWRVFGILVLITFIVWLIGQVVAVPFGLSGVIGGGAFGGSAFTWFALNALAGMIAATITAPFSAAATALLYIDRRIRREGLDIELARVAGVDLPGRRGPAPPSGTR